MVFRSGIGVLILAAVLLAGAAPALASCEAAFQIRTPGPIMLPGSCNYCEKSPVPNFTSSARVDFWSLGTGDPRPGYGDDNGEFQVRLLASDGRSAILPYDYSLSGPGHIQGTRSAGPFYNYYMTFNTNWGAHQLIDGCAADADVPGEICTCLLMGDQLNGRGYFAVRSEPSTPQGDFNFKRVGVTLSAVPKPQLSGFNFDSANGSLSMTVRVEHPTDGVKLSPDCDCAPISFRLYTQSVPSGEDVPHDRDRTAWESVSEPTPLGRPAKMEVSCSADQLLMLAASLVFADGFESRYLSETTVVTGCTSAAKSFSLAAPPAADPESAEFLRQRAERNKEAQRRLDQEEKGKEKEKEEKTEEDPSSDKKSETLKTGIVFVSGVFITLLVMIVVRKRQRS